MRQFRLLTRTAEKLREMGVTPQQVPLKLLFPIVDNASIEESDELQDRWANLLARAANPKEASKISIAFPGMLRELSPRHVKFLDALYDDAQGTIKRSLPEEVGFGYIALLSAFSDAGLARHPVAPHTSITMAQWELGDVKADYEEIALAMDMFSRHRIFELAYELPRKQWDSINDPELDSRFQFTRIGILFVEACREPRAKT